MDIYVKYFDPDLIPLEKLQKGDWIELTIQRTEGNADVQPIG